MAVFGHGPEHLPLSCASCLSRAPADRQLFADALQFVPPGIKLFGELRIRGRIGLRLQCVDRLVAA